jgi:CRP-like cAMP-binding protein
MAKKKLDSLQPIEELFSAWDILTPDERQFVRRNHIKQSFKKNEMIQYEGDTPSHMMVLASGKAKVFKSGKSSRTHIMRMLKPGDNFSYRAIIANGTHNTNVAAIEASTVYMLKSDVFLSILRHNNAFCYRFLEELASDLAASDVRSIALTQKHIRGRLADALLQLYYKYGVEKDGATICMYLSRVDLANLSNMNTSNAIRTLTHFVSEQIIAMDGRKLKIIDLDKLVIMSQLG